MTEQIAIPTEILHLISQGNKTGCLIVTDPKDNLVQWKLYFHKGQINYATSLIGQKERLTYLGQRFQAPLNFSNSDLENAEYREICNYWLTQKLPILDLQKLTLKLTQETLIQISALGRTSVTFLPNYQIKPTLINYSWQEFSKQFQTLIQQWKQLRTEITSPFVRLCLDSQRIFDFYKAWQTWSKEAEFSSVFGTQTLSTWLQNLSQKKCLYEIATQMQVCPLKLALKLQPLVKTRAIVIFPFQEANQQPVVEIELSELPQPSERAIVRTQKIVVPPLLLDERTEPLVSGESLRRNGATTALERPTTRTEPIEDILKHSGVRYPYERTAPRPIIACIDDSKTVQQQVKMTLEAVGYQMLPIVDPASTLTVLVRQKPVLILLDINMPEINGYELCQMLNRSRKLREIPIVMLTGREGIVDRLRAKFIGVSDYLTKPFDPNQLIEVVQQLAPLSCSI